ncbi:MULTISPECIES: hypothetical protein [Acinetobacter]|uniref:Uncharacterized protein n=1 Tax=Acinetobacter entericus TaxID=2989714 RepID=A0ABT3NG66_9GAMM|nr:MULTISPECIES: hypothetical protein [Acinetobacter]MCW8038503.1 hypothetical protein [Acinetobacter entericus]QXW25830.1 hypothetical protein KXJ74_16540 [Acinetobacter johnsonii]
MNEKAPEVIRGLFFSLPLLLLRLIQKRDVHKFQDEMLFSSAYPPSSQTPIEKKVN